MGQVIENTDQLYFLTVAKCELFKRRRNVFRKGPQSAFYSRALRVELYANKRQRAILLAAQTPALPAFHHAGPGQPRAGIQEIAE